MPVQKVGISLSTNIRFEPWPTYLQVTVTGQFNLIQAQEHFTQIVAAAEEHGLDKIIVDYRRMEGPMSILDRYNYAKYASDLLTGRRLAHVMKFAYVGMDLPEGAGGFGVTVAANRGVRVQLFSELEPAKEWLEKG